MFYKILVPILFIIAQLIVAWYGDFTGKLATKSSFLGFEYDGLFWKATITHIKYFWVLLSINFFFTLAFHFGFEYYRNFLVIAILWIAAGPIAALIYNSIVLKETADLPLYIGVVLIFVGSIFVVAHKEIVAWYA